jgi:hypothetical protein
MEIQNTVDQLVAYGLADITDFKAFGKASRANYRISEGGKEAVLRLREYSVEDEKAWWIGCITRLAYAYSLEDKLKENTKFNGLDSVVELVYQERTFVDLDRQVGFRGVVDFKMDEGATKKLIEFTKQAIKGIEVFSELPEKAQAELILVALFEQLFANYLSTTDER